MRTDQLRAFPGTYRDSLLLLSATRAMQDGDGVSWTSAAMATPTVVADLIARGFPADGLAGADANTLVLAVQAADGQAADEAFERGRAALFSQAGQAA
ncbi:MAG: protein FdrA, partial [Gemmatimonadota bacterium]